MNPLHILKNGFDPKIPFSLDMVALSNAKSAIEIDHGVEVEVRQ